MDAATRAGLEAHERHGWRAGHVPRSTLGPSGEASASHLARAVPSCLLLALSSPVSPAFPFSSLQQRPNELSYPSTGYEHSLPFTSLQHRPNECCLPFSLV